jgi:hypothetical protein
MTIPLQCPTEMPHALMLHGPPLSPEQATFHGPPGYSTPRNTGFQTKPRCPFWRPQATVPSHVTRNNESRCPRHCRQVEIRSHQAERSDDGPPIAALSPCMRRIPAWQLGQRCTLCMAGAVTECSGAECYGPSSSQDLRQCPVLGPVGRRQWRLLSDNRLLLRPPGPTSARHSPHTAPS